VNARSGARVVLDLARAGNFPSVASNVLAALVLARGGAWPAPGEAALAVAAGWLAYAGGATLNDVADATFDARHRPGRPIPRGALSRGGAALLGGAELALGLALLAVLGAAWFWIAGLAAVILAYDWVHKRWAGSVVLMAGCRILLGLAVASGAGWAGGWAVPGWLAALGVYIVGLSLLARREYVPGAPVAWLGRRVGQLLAGIPLVDAAALVVINAPGPALACALAVPLGRLAQRLAAAD
jgi:4-hydroxybenzoate polyprenyltransferase